MKTFDTEQELRVWMKERGNPIRTDYDADVDSGSESFISVYEEDGEHWAVQGWGYYDGMYGTFKPRYYNKDGKYFVKKAKLVPVNTFRVEILEGNE